MGHGLAFTPGVKVGYDITKKVNAGIEYYADYGRLWQWDGLHDQQQQIFAVTDLNVSPKWEINMGVGIGPTGRDGSPDREEDSGAAFRLGPPPRAGT